MKIEERINLISLLVKEGVQERCLNIYYVALR